MLIAAGLTNMTVADLQPQLVPLRGQSCDDHMPLCPGQPWVLLGVVINASLSPSGTWFE